VILAACSGASGSTSLPPPTTAPPTSTAALAHATTTAPLSTTTSTTPTQVLPPEGEVDAAWKAFWEAWAEVRASNRLDPGPLQQVASAAVVEDAVALFERERESGPGAIETEVDAGATVVDLGTDHASIEDCVLLSPSFTATTGVHYEAELRLQPRGWVITELRIPSGAGCVPAEMAEAAIAGYEAYYDAEAEFWDPANPTHQLLDSVLAEPQLSFIVGLLEDHAARGVALRGQPTTHPEVIEVRGPEELVILSCSEPHPDYGVYDVDTGERLPDEPPVRQGQRDLQSAVMVLDEGIWKVSDLQGQVDFACEFAPTDRGLPAV
jgi:hypothetical protein